MKKKTGLILSGILLFSLVLTVGLVMAATDTTTATVTVNAFLSVTLTDAPIEFISMNPGQTSNANVSRGFPLNATIGPESNVNANVQTRANTANFTGPVNTLAVSNLEWSATDFSGTNYTTSDTSVCGSVAPGAGCEIYHRLTIPSAQAAGSYSVGITITAT